MTGRLLAAVAVPAAAVAVGVAAVVAVAGGDTATEAADYAAVCVDAGTGVRVADSRCDTYGSASGPLGYAWWYVLASQAVPGVGGSVRPFHPLPVLPVGSTGRPGVPYAGFTPSSSVRRPPLSGGTGYKAPAYRAPAPAPARPAPTPKVGR